MNSTTLRQNLPKSVSLESALRSYGPKGTKALASAGNQTWYCIRVSQVVVGLKAWGITDRSWDLALWEAMRGYRSRNYRIESVMERSWCFAPCSRVRVPDEKSVESIGQSKTQLLQRPWKFGDASTMRQPQNTATSIECRWPEPGSNLCVLQMALPEKWSCQSPVEPRDHGRVPDVKHWNVCPVEFWI